MSDLNVTLRITADANQAIESVRSIRSELTGIGAPAAAAGTQLKHAIETMSSGAVGLSATLSRSTADLHAQAAAAQAAAADLHADAAAAQAAAAAQRAFSPALDSVTTDLHAQAAAAQAAAGGLHADAAAAQSAVAAQRALTPALDSNTDALRRTGLTAGEYKAAMRTLPAQITDIVTSLISGQPAYLVAIQQGGQLKDSFGGVGNAARALIGAISPMTVGLGALAAAAGVVVAGFVRGRAEAHAIERALINTGAVAEVTAGQVQLMSAALDDIGGVTRSKAAQTLAELAATGKIAGDQLQSFAAVAIDADRQLQISTQQMASRFSALGDDPARASAKLNAELHYLSIETYRQIAALQEQGRITDAVRLAQQAFADATSDRAVEMSANIGSVERGWRALKDTIAEVGDAISGIGRVAPPDEELARLKTERGERALGSGYGNRGRGAGVFQAADARERELQLIVDTAAAESRRAAEQQRANDQLIAGEDAKRRAAETAERAAQSEAAAAARRSQQISGQIDLLQRQSDLMSTGLNADDAAYAAQYESLGGLERQLLTLQRNTQLQAAAASASAAADQALVTLRDENQLLAEGYDLDKAREEIRLRSSGYSDAQIAEYRVLTDAQAAAADAQQALQRADDDARRIAADNAEQVRQTIDSLQAENEALKAGALAEDARTRARLASLNAGADQIDQILALQDAARGRGYLADLGIASDGVSDADAAAIGDTLKELDALDRAFEQMGGSGVQAFADITSAARLFASAATQDGEIALSTYVKGSAAALGGIQSMSTQGTAAYQRLGVAVSALNAVSAVAAILNQGSGDPYSAFGRMAAMAAIVGSLGVQVSGTFGGGGNSGGGSATTSTAGTGTVLGDSSAESESIARSLSALEGYAETDLGYSQRQLIALNSIDAAIRGVAAGLSRNFALTGNATTIGVDNVYRPGLGAGINDLYADFRGLDPAYDLTSAITSELFGASAAIFDIGGQLIGGVLDGAFSSFAQVKDTGLLFAAGQTLGDVISSGMVDAAYYATVRTGSNDLFGNDTNTKVRDYTADMDTQLQQQLTDVIIGLGDSVIAAAEVLGVSADDAAEILNNTELGLDKISLDGLTGDEIEDRLNAAFSALGDTFATAVLPEITEFQKAGEGAYETLLRVASETQIVTSYLDSLGLSLSGLAELDAARVGQDLIDMAGGLESFEQNVGTFYSKFYSDDEQMARLQDQLGAALGDIGYELPDTRDGYRDLVAGLDLTTESGQEAFTALTALSGAADEYYSSLEESAQQYADAADALADYRASLYDTYSASLGLTLSQQRSTFDQQVRAARLGDIDALESLPETAAALEAASLAGAGSKDQYLRDLARIQQGVAAAEDTATRLSMQDLAVEQLDALNEQTELLESIDNALVDDDVADTTAAAETSTVTASAATEQSSSTSSSDLQTIIAQLTEINALMTQLTTYAGKTQASTRLLDEWDAVGMPPERAA